MLPGSISYNGDLNLPLQCHKMLATSQERRNVTACNAPMVPTASCWELSRCIESQKICCSSLWQSLVMEELD